MCGRACVDRCIDGYGTRSEISIWIYGKEIARIEQVIVDGDVNGVENLFVDDCESDENVGVVPESGTTIQS